MTYLDADKLLSDEVREKAIDAAVEWRYGSVRVPRNYRVMIDGIVTAALSGVQAALAPHPTPDPGADSSPAAGGAHLNTKEAFANCLRVATTKEQEIAALRLADAHTAERLAAIAAAEEKGRSEERERLRARLQAEADTRRERASTVERPEAAQLWLEYALVVENAASASLDSDQGDGQ
jgi:hypothetical protein